MNIEQLSLKAISNEEMVLINGGTEVLIDQSSFAYQLGYTVGQAVRNAATAYGVYALLFL